MNRVGILCFIGGVLLESGVLLAQSTLNNNPDLRAWTRTDGKSVTAQYLGVLNQNVYLKLADGRVVPCPLSSLSSEDGAFVKAHPMTYRANWQAWPASIPMISISVRGEPVPGGKVVYTTRKFRFSSDVDIGADLMKDLGRVFEMTYDLHSVSPFGILATPNNGFYQAELYGTAANYQKAGGPPKTAGVYKIKERVFLAPLDTMGVESGPKGWRKISKADYNASTVVHELTHMLTHDMISCMPIWFNEGYAEYVSNIPIESCAFQTSQNKIKKGMIDILMKDQELLNRKVTAADIGYAGGGAPKKAPKENPKKMTFDVLPIASVLTMTNEDWEKLAVANRNSAKSIMPGVSPATKLMLQHYRAAHLILYYFIQIEGGKGVARIRRMLDDNQGLITQMKEYSDKFKLYETAFAEFKSQPGVKELPDGRIEYPTGLKPPVAPVAPVTDENMLKSNGIKALLGGESAEVVGKRIETALKENLGIDIVFGT